MKSHVMESGFSNKFLCSFDIIINSSGANFSTFVPCKWIEE